MKPLVLTLVFMTITAVGCKNEEAKKPATQPTPQARVPEPSRVAKTREPNNEKELILGKWNAKGEEPLQLEFTPTELTIRSGKDLKQSKTVSYTMRNEISPSEIDWGTGADAGYGLYTIEGDGLWIDFNLGSPDSRPKKPGKQKTAKQWELTRVK